MKRVRLALAGAILAACAGDKNDGARDEARLNRAANEPGLSVAMCGAVASYTAATRTDPGWLAIDRRAWAIVPGASVAGDTMLVHGAAVCVDAELDTTRRIVSCVVSVPQDPGWPSE